VGDHAGVRIMLGVFGFDVVLYDVELIDMCFF
jgi:hypothetical protein